MATELDKLVVKIEADLSQLKKEMAKANKEVQTSSQKIKKSLGNIGNTFANIGTKVAKFGSLLGIAFGAIAIKKVVDTGTQIENLQVRLKALFGSADEGAKAFDTMVKFASKVPFTLNDIQQASGNLAVVADDADHLAELLEITGNVASATGLDFKQTAEQIQRSFSGGIASADIFRERGVRAMLGFQVGAEVSIDETIKRFKEVFSEGGEFGNVTADFAKTLTGTLSMLSDKLFQFQKAIADEFFAELKLAFGDLNANLEKNSEKIQKFGRDVGRFLADLTVSVVENIDTIKKALMSLAIFLSVTLVVSLARAIKRMGMLGKILTGISISLGFVIEAIQSFETENEKLNKQLAEGQGLLKTMNELYIDTTESQEKNNQKTAEATEKSKEYIKALKDQHNLQLEMFETANSEMQPFFDIIDGAGKQISDTFGKAIASGESFRQSMLDIFQSVIAQVISLIIQLTIVEPLLQSIRGALTGSFGGGFAGEPSGSMVYGARAMGGNVNPNMPYMVGERGAEMFVPKSAGTIVPNNQMGGGIVIEQNLNFATGVSQTVRAEVMNLLPAIQQSTLSAVQDARLRGGTFAKDFGA